MRSMVNSLVSLRAPRAGPIPAPARAGAVQAASEASTARSRAQPAPFDSLRVTAPLFLGAGEHGEDGPGLDGAEHAGTIEKARASPSHSLSPLALALASRSGLSLWPLALASRSASRSRSHHIQSERPTSAHRRKPSKPWRPSHLFA